MPPSRRQRRVGRRGTSRAPTPALQICDRCRPRTNRMLLARVVRAALQHAGRPALPVSLLLCGDAEIARIHADFLADPSPTDVLAFDLGDVAEVVVSVETARRCARAHGSEPGAEVALYVVHGLLHVCGHDDVAPRARARMRAAERAVMLRLGLRYRDVDPRARS